MNEDLISLVILNNAASYDLKFAGIAFQQSVKAKYLLVIFSNDDVVIQKQYKSMKSTKIGFARSYHLISREKNIKPEWSRELLSYSFQKGKEKKKA